MRSKQSSWWGRHSRLLVGIGTAAALVALAFALVGAVYFVWFVPITKAAHYQRISQPKLKGEEVFQIENDARKTNAEIVGGLFVLITVCVGLRNMWIAQENMRIAQENMRISEDKQISDRFIKATESLESDKLTVRLGGIYSLERIARDSQSDHWTVMEVLCAWIRDRSGTGSCQVTEGKPEPATADSQRPLPTDAQAIMSVIRRRKWADEEEQQLPLTKADLRMADLGGALLADADLTGADLRGAILTAADLTGADLNRAYLNDALLIHAYLSRSDLSSSDLRWANLEGTHLPEANLSKADLSGANLEGADLTKADIRAANLSGAILYRADLRGANLEGADLTGADVERVQTDKDTVWPKGFALAARPAAEPPGGTP